MSGCSDCGCAFGRAGSLQRRLSSPVTQLCSSPALPSLHPLFSPAGRGCPSTWTGPSLLPRSEPWMLDTWRGWSDCRRGRSDALQPGDKTICYGPLKRKKKIKIKNFDTGCTTQYEDHQHRIHFSSHWLSGLTDFGITSLVRVLGLKIKLRLTTSPIKAARFGATWLILDRRYSCSSSR